MAKTVVFDFDGVIHSYTSGWQGEDTILDPPVPGIREALKEIRDAGYEVVVVSTRCATIKGHGAIEAWLYDNGLREYIDKVCKEKPPAVAYIDDRAICFDGHPETLLKKIKNFQPWYKNPTLTPPNEALTLEQLREMEGQWIIIKAFDADISGIMPAFIKDQFATTLCELGSKAIVPDLCEVHFSFNEYGKTWLAYRRPPEGEA